MLYQGECHEKDMDQRRGDRGPNDRSGDGIRRRTGTSGRSEQAPASHQMEQGPVHRGEAGHGAMGRGQSAQAQSPGEERLRNERNGQEKMGQEQGDQRAGEQKAKQAQTENIKGEKHAGQEVQTNGQGAQNNHEQGAAAEPQSGQANQTGQAEKGKAEHTGQATGNENRAGEEKGKTAAQEQIPRTRSARPAAMRCKTIARARARTHGARVT